MRIINSISYCPRWDSAGLATFIFRITSPRKPGQFSQFTEAAGAHRKKALFPESQSGFAVN